MKRRTVACCALILGSTLFIASRAAPPAPSDLRVDITDPADHHTLAWGSQGSYAITVSYDGKSSKFNEIASDEVLLGAAFMPDTNAATVRRVAPLPQALAEISQAHCTGCHDFNGNSAGPSFAAIGARYAGKQAAITTLAAHIRNGSRGSWGAGSMPAHPDLGTEQAGAIARWIVDHGADPSIHYYVGKSGGFRMIPMGKPGPRAGMALTAYYTGPLKSGDTRSAAGRNLVVLPGPGS